MHYAAKPGAKLGWNLLHLKENRMARLRNLLASLLVSSSAAVAQPQGLNPLGPDVAIMLNLDTARAIQVNAILAQARLRTDEARRQLGNPPDAQSFAILVTAMEAIAADADRQLSQVLTWDEIDQWRAILPERAHARRWTAT
jgi:hypothetical protein